MRWLLTLAGGYAGAGAAAFVLYRAHYVRTRHVREWTDRRGQQLAGALDRLCADLLELRRHLHGHLHRQHAPEGQMRAGTREAAGAGAG
jgi:hypothetical protein